MRSVRHLIGQTVEAKDGVVGHLEDFLVEDTRWHIPQMVVEANSRQEGQHVVLPTSLISAFHCEEKTILLEAEKADIRDAALYQPEN